MREASSAEAKDLVRGAAVKERAVNWERWGILYARLALGAAFLSGIADRFGLVHGQECRLRKFRGIRELYGEGEFVHAGVFDSVSGVGGYGCGVIFGPGVSIGRVAAVGGIRERGAASAVWDCDGDFIWDQIADGLFGVFGFGRSGFAGALSGTKGSDASVSGIV